MFYSFKFFQEICKVNKAQSFAIFLLVSKINFHFNFLNSMKSFLFEEALHCYIILLELFLLSIFISWKSLHFILLRVKCLDCLTPFNRAERSCLPIKNGANWYFVRWKHLLLTVYFSLLDLRYPRKRYRFLR